MKRKGACHGQLADHTLMWGTSYCADKRLNQIMLFILQTRMYTPTIYEHFKTHTYKQLIYKLLDETSIYFLLSLPFEESQFTISLPFFLGSSASVIKVHISPLLLSDAFLALW